MLDHFLQFVVKQRLMLLIGAVVLLGAGVLAWQRLPVDAFPDVTNVQVMVLTEAPGLAPAEVERLITYPIEVQMGGLPNVRQVRSLSKSGLSQVIVIFEDRTDTYFARQVVFERLTQAREGLPEGLDPEMGPISTGLGEIYQYAVEAGWYCTAHPDEWSREAGACPQCGTALVRGEHDATSLRTVQDWIIAPQLRRLAGVTEVNSFGGFVKQYHVIPDPDLLLKYGIGVAEVVDALESNNANASGGFLTRGWEQINVVTRGLTEGMADIENIVLRAEDGTPVLIRDVAAVRPGTQPRNGAVTKDGRGDTVAGMAIMLKGENSKVVVDRVRAAIPGIQKSLPPGVKIVPFYDRTTLIQACIATVSGALGQGILLVIAVLFLIMWDLRAALTVALVLPLTAAVAFLLMGWQGVTANLMSLGGLAIAVGMVVDGAIVVTENIARHMRERAAEPLSRAQIALDALREVARPVVFAILIIAVVFLPLFTLEEMEGKMSKPLALTMCFALAGSLIMSLTVVPALASLLVRRAPVAPKANFLLRGMEAVYTPVLSLALRGRWITIALAAGIMVGVFALLPTLGTEFLPALDEGALAINAVRLPTAGVEGTALQSGEVERILLERIPEVTTVVSKTGRAEISEDPMGPEQTDFLIMLKPLSEWRKGLTREGLVREIGRELSDVPGMRLAFSQPIALRVNELISGIKSDVAIKIFGDDLEVLRAVAERVAPELSAIAGAGDVKIEQVSGFTQMEIQIDRRAMARHKINAADVNALVETAVGGQVATTLFEGPYRFDVLVRFPLERRNDADALERLLVAAPGGYNVPLGELAKVREADVPAQISREDGRRRLIVECNVRDRDLGSFVQEARTRLAGIEAGLPTGYSLEYGGQFENQQRAMARLKVVVPVAILLIFLMLYGALNSVKSAVLVLVNLPFALVGGIAAIWILDIHLSVSASIGFIALFGVAVENGLLLVSFFDQHKADGRHIRAAVFDACRLRLRPLMMTTATTLLGLLPMLYATGSGSEIQQPLVAVIFGGLISSLALTLIILPVLYALCNGYRAEETPVAVPAAQPV